MYRPYKSRTPSGPAARAPPVAPLSQERATTSVTISGAEAGSDEVIENTQTSTQNLTSEAPTTEAVQNGFETLGLSPELLKAVADCLHRALDAQGLSFRIGGEEFVVLLPGLDATAAVMTAERLRRAVANLRIPHAADVGGLATVSIGVACADPGAGHPPEALFVAADAALYAAKKAGRNRVRAAPSADPMALARRA